MAGRVIHRSLLTHRDGAFGVLIPSVKGIAALGGRRGALEGVLLHHHLQRVVQCAAAVRPHAVLHRVLQRLVVEDDVVLLIVGAENDALADSGDAVMAFDVLCHLRDHRAVFAGAGFRLKQLIARSQVVDIRAVAQVPGGVGLGIPGVEHIQLRALLLHSEGEGSGVVDLHRTAAVAAADGGRIPHGEAAEFLRRDADGGADLADALGVNGGLGVVGVGAVRPEAWLVRGGIHILQHVVDGIVGILGVFGIVEGDDIIR